MAKLSDRYTNTLKGYITPGEVSSTYTTIETTNNLSSAIVSLETELDTKKDVWNPSMISRYMSGALDSGSTGRLTLDTTAKYISGDDPIGYSSSGNIVLPKGYMYRIVLQGGMLTSGRLTLEVYSASLGDGHLSSPVSLHDCDESRYGGHGTSAFTYDRRNANSSDTIYVNCRFNSAASLAGYDGSTRGGTMLTVTQIVKRDN